MGQSAFSARDAILLATVLGLACGYLDLLIILIKKYFWNDMRNFGTGRDFPWSVPFVHTVLLLTLAVLLAVLNRLRPRGVTISVGSRVLATVAIWSALLRVPVYGASSLLLAAGIGRWLGGAVVVQLTQEPRRFRNVLLGLVGMLIGLLALSSGRQAVGEQRARAGLVPASADARNVILIVWDTVRAESLSLYDYPRETTPNLARWASKGVRFSRALAPAPWTYPSHSCFFTGQWPMRVNSQWQYRLDSSIPTLAEYLASRGYQTGGFSANTACCSYETGLDRGFIHYEDFPLTLWSLIGRTVPGSWIRRNVLSLDVYDQKWINLQSRNARGINGAFLDWLRGRRRDRPFFAFLNYFDAHDPYVPPALFAGRFGIRPTTAREYQLLIDLSQTKDRVAVRDIVMARDCYDDCIAFLDDQLGRLLEELDRQRLLEDTLVIVTSDHGEGFGTHGGFGHGNNLNLEQIAVPLVILAPDEPAKAVVSEPVSLRDMPATVVDLLGLSAGSPFPGHSLAALWRSAPGQAPAEVTPAFSEMAQATAFRPEPRPGMPRRGLKMSLVALGRHYVRDGTGAEQLYDLGRDPYETVDLKSHPESGEVVNLFRRMLLKVLNENPGSIEVENAYLKPYRQSLKFLVDEISEARPQISAQEKRSNLRRN
jgi:arylsulfatase A-like enzyme